MQKNSCFGVTISFIVSFACLCSPCVGQTPVKLLRSNSTSVDVREGKKLRKGYWQVSPKLLHDIYYAHRFSGQISITFISDIDSASFNLEAGSSADFIILLNGKDSCRTEISTLRSSYYKIPSSAIGRDTIPFTLGRDNRVYINGSINGSPELRFLFDNGADNTIVFPSAFAKGLKIIFDDSIQNNSTGGSGMRQTSNTNNLQLGKMRWRNELVMLVDKQIGDHADGTIGYDVFEDKILEIDYDKMLMIAHSSSFPASPGSQAFLMDLTVSQVPFLKTTMTISGLKYPKSFMFDMGATGCLFLNYNYVSRNELDRKLLITGSSQRSGAGATAMKTQVAILPLLEIGQFKLRDLPINIQTTKGYKDQDAEEFGMEVLRRFNTVLDYQNNIIYLTPNHFINSPFRLGR